MEQSKANSPLSQPGRQVRTQIGQPTTTHEPRSTQIVTATDIVIPDYVEHRDEATEIGKLSAEAVVRDYEAVAKEIESMGGELIERVRQFEALSRNTYAVTAELNEIAARYRAEAKRTFDHIESSSILVADVRNICTDLKEKIAAR